MSSGAIRGDREGGCGHSLSPVNGQLPLQPDAAHSLCSQAGNELACIAHFVVILAIFLLNLEGNPCRRRWIEWIAGYSTNYRGMRGSPTRSWRSGSACRLRLAGDGCEGSKRTASSTDMPRC